MSDSDRFWAHPALLAALAGGQFIEAAARTAHVLNDRLGAPSRWTQTHAWSNQFRVVTPALAAGTVG